ncbi:MAG: TRAP transporter substrate-binding protein DctP, partial [Gammaproteobacteria bacterium]|nr:TRAP transporter substrate-binding protein DctP [Gammaproteobacteria bacterium]
FEKMGVYFAHCDCTSPYNIISKTPIRSLEDLNGIKIRATGGLTSEILRELGAVPVAIAAAETYPAFQRGVIDAVSLSASDIVAYRLQEIGLYYTRVDINILVLHYCLNQRSFDALPQDLRIALYQLLRIRSQLTVQNFYSGSGYEHAFETLRESGVEIFELEEDELNRWREKVAPLKERYIAQQEAAGLSARAAVNDLESLAAEYASLSNSQINDRIMNSPTQGIIDL